MDDFMKDKAMCVVDFKPDTDVGIFWLKNPDGLEFDMSPELEERKPKIVKMKSRQDGIYMGTFYLKFLSFSVLGFKIKF